MINLKILLNGMKDGVSGISVRSCVKHYQTLKTIGIQKSLQEIINGNLLRKKKTLMDEINKLIKDFIRDGHYNKSDEYHKEFKLYAVDSAGYDVDDSVELSIKDNKIVLTF